MGSTKDDRGVGEERIEDVRREKGGRTEDGDEGGGKD